MRRLLLLALPLFALSSPARAEPPAAAPVATFPAPSSGFIDDAFAIRSDGKAIAYLTTDGASQATLHLAEFGGAQTEVPNLPVTVSALHWLGPDRLLIVSRSADGQSVSGQVFTAKGPTKDKIAAVRSIALATVANKPAVVTFARNEKRGVDYVFTAIDRATWKPLAKKTFHGDAEGRITQPGPFKPLWWYDGYTMGAVLKAGEFDKARDMRRPDRFARFDVFAGRVLDEHEIEDVLAFAQVGALHAAHPDEESFALFSEDHRKLLLVDGLEQHELTVARPLMLYDAETLAYHPADPEGLAVSLTIDPVNPAALKRKKSDPDDIDLYVVDRRAHAATLRLRLAGQGRPSAWQIVGGRVGLLRKSKGFDRGGVALEVYDLPAAPSSAP